MGAHVLSLTSSSIHLGFTEVNWLSNAMSVERRRIRLHALVCGYGEKPITYSGSASNRRLAAEQSRAVLK